MLKNPHKLFSFLNRCVSRSANTNFITNHSRSLIFIFILILCCGYSSAAKTDQLIEKALEAARSGPTETAIPLLEQAEKKHPFHSANSEVLYQLGSAYLDENKIDSADAAFNKLLIRYGKYADQIPRVDDAVVAQAQILIARKKYDLAIQHIKKFLEDRPKSEAKDSAYYQLAVAYIEKGDLDAARKLLNPVAADKNSTMHDAAIFLLANIAAKEKNFDETEKLMQLLAKTAKNKGARNNALFRLGDIYRKNGNLIKAIDQYRRIKSTENDAAAKNLNAGILFEIAQTYEKLGHPLEAHIAFDGVARFYSDTSLSTEAWHRAILSDADYGNFKRAEESYLDFLKTYADKSAVGDVRLYLAQKQISKKDYSNAIYNLKAGLKEFPTNNWAETSFNLLGVTYLNAKQYKNAENTLNEFAKKFPDSELVPESYYYLAQSFLEQKRYEAAIRTFDSLANDFSSSDLGKEASHLSQITRMDYAQKMAETNRFLKAIELYREITATDLVENVSFLIGETYMQAGQYDNAAIAFNDFINRFPDSDLAPQASFSIGDAQMQGEKYTEAEQSFKNIIESGLPKTNPVLPVAQLQIAFCKYYLEDTPGMSNALATVIANYPDDESAGDAYYWLGYLLRSFRSYSAAAGMYEKLIEKFPSHSYAMEAAYLIGESYSLDNNFAKALEALKSAFKKYPFTGYGVYSLVRAGDIYNKKYNQLDTFISEADTLVTKKETAKVNINVAKAGVLMHANQPDKAAAVMPKLDLETLRYNDILGYALALQAGIQNEKKQFITAEATAEQAVQICSQTGVGLNEALLQKARALFNQKKYEQAEPVYAKLLAECVIPDNQENALALLDRAECLLNLMEYDEIVSICDQALRMRPGSELSARGTILKGQSMLNKKEYTNAAQYFKRGVILYGRIEEYGIPAYRGLIESYKKLGLTEQAAEAEKKFIELYPNAK